ncbi:MAG: hypothetical protein KY462_16260 [Actinobacteria bacterium]|nr:hypothetical protein [Actinomycetota bacterium]
MTTILLVLVPLLVLPVVLLFSFAGCVGEGPYLKGKEEGRAIGKEEGFADGRAEGEQIGKDTAAADAAAEAAAKKYDNIVRFGPAEDLRGYWRLDDQGVTAADVHTNVAADRHDGAYVNPAAVNRTVPGALSVGQDPLDRAAEFDGATGYVEVDYHLLLNPPVDLTVEAWVRPDPTIASREVVVGSFKESAGALVSGYSLEVVMTPTPKVVARLGNPGADTTLEAALGDGLERDGWRHVVMTYTQKEKCLRLYVNADNATPDESVGSVTVPVFYVANGTERLRIGAGPGPDATPVRPFHGRIDEVAVYGLPLAGARVQAHFKAAISVL